jgi:hypothetical protein
VTFKIRSNQAAPDVEIPSLGTFVPGGGGELTLADLSEQQQALVEQDVRLLASDGLYPGAPDPNSNSIIVNVDGQDVPPSDFDGLAGADVFSGATALADGSPGLVPAPVAGQTSSHYLSGDGTWRLLPSGTQLPDLEQPTQPSGAQIPDGFWLFWWDTSTLRLFIVRNRASAMYQVQLTVQP